MGEKDARTILEEQFKLLAEINKKCEPELINKNIESMFSIYNLLYPKNLFGKDSTLESLVQGQKDRIESESMNTLGKGCVRPD